MDHFHFFGNAIELPDLKTDYEKYGELWLAPRVIFDNAVYWFDDSHLNMVGANAYSAWLAQRIRKQAK